MLVLQVTTASNNHGVGLDVTILQQKHPNSFSCCYALQMIWREMFDFSEDAVLLVLASEYYTEDDYIRNYDFYLEEAKKYYN